MSNWLRQHPLGFQGIFFGIVFPILMWFSNSIFRLQGFPHPQQPVSFMVYWVLLGSFSGGLYYALQRVITGVMRPH